MRKDAVLRPMPPCQAQEPGKEILTLADHWMNQRYICFDAFPLMPFTGGP